MAYTPQYIQSGIGDFGGFAKGAVKSVVPAGIYTDDIDKEVDTQLNKILASDQANKAQGLWGGLQKLLNDLANFVNGLVSTVMRMVMPNSTAAEYGMNQRIAESAEFEAIETQLGIPGLANQLRGLTTASVRNLVGWTGIPNDPAMIIQNAAALHHDIFKTVKQEVFARTSGAGTVQERLAHAEQVAYAVATMVSGYTPDMQQALVAVSEEDSAIQQEALRELLQTNPPAGYVGMVLATSAAVKNTPRGTYSENAVSGFRMSRPVVAANTQQPSPEVVDEAQRVASANIENPQDVNSVESPQVPPPPANEQRLAIA